MNELLKNSLRSGPDGRGRFGEFGGRFVAETLMPLILELETAYEAAKADPSFQSEIDYYLKHYVGRPSALWFAERLTKELGGAKIYFKRDELNHTGAHKINNCIGQILLARRMGKTRIIAETGAGQHGVATATVCALFGLPCTIYMGAVDVERQKPNVFRMKLLGAEVIPVKSGAATLKDAMNDAMRDWVANVRDTFYIIGTAAGPHPYPAMVRDFQCVIGEEAKAQLREAEGRLPDVAIAAIGGGSNAIGLFHPFLDDASVRLIGVEAAGHGWIRLASAPPPPRSHAAALACCTATGPICCRTKTGKSWKRIQSRLGSTIPASARNIPGCTISAGWNMLPSPITRRWTPSSSAPAPKALFPPWSRRTHWPTSPSWRRAWIRIKSS